MSLLVIGAVKGLGMVMPEVSLSAETSIAEGGAIVCFDSVRCLMLMLHETGCCVLVSNSNSLPI
jgi:hypothetical protein